MILTSCSSHTQSVRRPGYVLIAVLIVIVVLSLAAYRFADSMSGEYRAGVRISDAALARSAAISGIHYAAALLADPVSFADILGGDPSQHNPDAFSEQTVSLGQNSGREVRFSIVSVAMVSAGQYEQRNALTDEGGKLNINALIAHDPTGEALYNALIQLPMLVERPDIADAIVDWVDVDDVARADGAENSYYQGLGEPYKAKNGPLNSIGELLLVRDLTPQLLYGTDQNQSGGGDRGLIDYLTVHGREVTVSSSGLLKIFLNGSEAAPIYLAMQDAGLGDEMAAYIMAAKLFGWTAVPLSDGTSSTVPQSASLDQLVSAVETKLETPGNSRAITSIMDLINSQVSIQVAGDNGQMTSMVYYCPLNDASQLRDLLPALLDTVTTMEDVEIVPRLNVNTAPWEVLMGVPGKAKNEQGQLNWVLPALTEDEVDAVMSARDSVTPGSLEARTGAWLLTSGALSADKYKAIEPYVTGSSMIYRVEVVGYIVGGGPAARFEAMIDGNLGMPRILYVRDLGDMDSPRAFPVSSRVNQ